MNQPDQSPQRNQRRSTPEFRLVEGLGRTLPHSLEAEEFLLSSCLCDGAASVARALRSGIRPESFYDSKHGLLFATLAEMSAKNIPVAAATLAEELKANQQLDQVGGYAFITQISRAVPTTAEAGYFIDRVFEFSMLRAQIRDCSEAVEACHAYSGNLDKLLSGQALRLMRRADYLARRAQAPLRERLEARLVATLAAAAGQVDRSRWVYTGLPRLDTEIGAFDVRREHWLNIIAGPPSGGKSSFMRAIAVHNVVAHKKRFAVFLLETGLMWVEAAAATLAQVPLNAIVEGQAPRDHVARYEQQYRELVALADDRLFVFDDIYFVEDIERKVRELDRTLRERDLAAAALLPEGEGRTQAEAAAHGLDGVVVDYLQIVPTRENLRGHREQIVAHVSMQLKRLFKSLNVPGFVGAQINRAAREDGAKAPTLAALRESGAIEQDADAVIFVHTPPTTRAGVEQGGHNSVDEVEIVQRKRRNGRKDVAHGILFTKAQTRYEERQGEAGPVRPGAPKPVQGYKRPGGTT
jgi:replicative DNA helicase